MLGVEPIHVPCVEDVLDWEIPIRNGGTKPLRHLSGDELLFAAGDAASIGDPWFADTLAAVADEVRTGTVVEHLHPERFHQLFWDTNSPIVLDPEEQT